MAKKCAFIREGQTRAGYLKETDLHPAVSFTFAPMLTVERTTHLNALNEFTLGKQREECSAAKMATRLKSWDLSDEDGNPAKITADNLLHLEPALFLKLRDVLLGFAAGDKEPAPEPQGAPAPELSAEAH